MLNRAPAFPASAALLQRAGGIEAETCTVHDIDAAFAASALPGRRQRQVAADVAKALPAHQFRLVYQPVVDLANGQMTGLEALLRWAHPTLGEVSPREFIAPLEGLPQIREVTLWVLDTALAELARWDRLPGPPLHVSINVPAEALADERFVPAVVAALARHGLSPHQLEVELTERSLATTEGLTVQRLRELRRHGVMVAIDDFGTGWSSLAYLARLPVDTLKIDPQFSRGATHSRADAAICRMTVELARGLGLRCVVEGIERAGQLRFFTDLHCREGQGFLFSRPLEAEAVDDLVARRPVFGGIRADVRAGAANERHVLIVDDDEIVLAALRRSLRPTGWCVHATPSTDEAFEWLACHPVGVVMCGQRLSQMSGSEFLGLVKELHPLARRIATSGEADLPSLTDAINHGAICKFLARPWVDAELLLLLQAAFTDFELAAANQRALEELQYGKQQQAETLEAQRRQSSEVASALVCVHAVLEAVAAPVFAIDDEARILLANAAAAALFGPGAMGTGQPLGDALGFDPRTGPGPDPRPAVIGGRPHRVHCRPLHFGEWPQGMVVTLQEIG